MRSRYRITADDGIYFTSSTIIEWLPVFIHKDYFDILIDTFKYCRQYKEIKIYAYVILENHFHAIVAGNNLSNVFRSMKRHSARAILKLAKTKDKKWLLNQFNFYKKRFKKDSDFQIWQEGFHPELILNEKMLVEKVDYIHFNPVKRGYIDKPEHWLYSSARNYILNDHSIIEIDELPR